MRNSGTYFFWPITMMVRAKPKEGSIPPATERPWLSHSGMAFRMDVTKSAPK